MNAVFRMLTRFQSVLVGATAVFFAGCKPGIMDGPGYHVRGGAAWFVRGWPDGAFEVNGADVATFEFHIKDWDELYARDKRHIYWSGDVIPGVDVATFAHISGGRYYRDKDNVYFDNQLVCDDAAHFEDISVLFVKNSRAVYSLALQDPPERRIVSTDVAHFRMIAPEATVSFHVDSRQLIVGLTVMTGVEPSEFKLLAGSYWRDAHHAYDFKDPMPEGTDVETLQVLDGLQYAKDSRRVYYGAKLLEGADPATFVVTDPKWPKGKDAKHRFDQGEVLTLDP